MLLMGWLVFSVAVEAQNGGGNSNLKPPKDANGIIVNFPSCKKNAPDRTQTGIYFDGESAKAVKSRVIEGVPVIRELNGGSDVSKKDPEVPLGLALYRSDGRTKVRVEVPKKYASGIVLIKVDNAFMTHLLSSQVFAVDVGALFFLGQQGVQIVELRVFPSGPLIHPKETGIRIVLEADMWSSSLTF